MTRSPFEQIFYQQSKQFAHPASSTMLEDFACKCIQAGHDMIESVTALGNLYRQCDEVAQANYNRMKIALTK